jgi:Kef-type K+ transport system membrane component KefB
MDRLASAEIITLFLALSTLLVTARVLGEGAKRLNQPAVLGEICAGILLGPTVLGTLVPGWTALLFPHTGRSGLVLDGLVTLGAALFLMVAGMEVNLSAVWKEGKPALLVSLMGILFPFSLGFAAAWFTPGLLGYQESIPLLVFALFFATALSISALPVIVKTLMDLHLYHSPLGTITVTAAIFNDLVGWLIFAVVLSLMETTPGHRFGTGQTLWLTLSYAACMLTVGRWLIHRVLPWLQAYTSWPGGVLTFVLALGLMGAAFTEWIGVHALFGPFFVGVAAGDSAHLREHTRSIISEFVSGLFAPLFFASIGLQVNFAAHFDGGLVLVVFLIACLGKVVGCGLGARWSGIAAAEAWALGFAMNSRGAMEIVLGLLALQQGMIPRELFVALVVMALATSLLSGPMIQRLLGRTTPQRFTDYLPAQGFLNPLQARELHAALAELAQALSPSTNHDAEAIVAAVLAGTQGARSWLSRRVAVFHAQLEGVVSPVIGMGLSQRGIVVSTFDTEPAQILFLLLTPERAEGVPLGMLLDIARTFRRLRIREKVLQVDSYVEFLALVHIESARRVKERKSPILGSLLRATAVKVKSHGTSKRAKEPV